MVIPGQWSYPDSGHTRTRTPTTPLPGYHAPPGTPLQSHGLAGTHGVTAVTRGSPGSFWLQRVGHNTRSFMSGANKPRIIKIGGFFDEK